MEEDETGTNDYSLFSVSIGVSRLASVCLPRKAALIFLGRGCSIENVSFSILSFVGMIKTWFNMIPFTTSNECASGGHLIL